MASFSIKSFDKKLKEMSSRQDSVQTVSLWLIHHRAHSKTVVSLWLDRVKKAKPDRRLLLFYLANDVIQNSRKKGKEFSQSFGKVLADAMQYLRDTSIRPSVERVLKIWQERKVFEKDLVKKLLDNLNNVSAKPKPKPKPEPVVPKVENDKVKKEKKAKRPVPTNFKTISVTRALATMQSIEDETERRQTLVKQMRLDASSSEGIKQLKDYAGGNRFSLEFEESSTKYEDLLQSLERESQHRQTLVNLLEDGDAYYQAALKEATIIANAYRSFGNRLHSMKKKLDNKIRKFATAEKEAPVSAPKASFLASGLSGILEQMNQSPAGTPNRSETEKTDAPSDVEKADMVVKEGSEKDVDQMEATEEKVVDPTIDHVEVSDMDIDSDSENGGDNTAESKKGAASKPAMSGSTETISSATAQTASPSVQPQYGYTMTVNSTEENETSSPASHDSAPSPEGSPDLNLEIYEGPPATNTLPSNQLDVMTNQSYFDAATTEQTSSSENLGQNTANLLAKLIGKQRQDDGVGEVDSPGQGSSISNTPVRDEGNDRPLLNLLGNILAPLVHSHTDTAPERVETNQAGGETVESFDTGVAQIESKLTDTAEASKHDSGPSTDEEGVAGDNTPEHGFEYGQAPPIIMQFPRPSIAANYQGPNPPSVGGAPFMSPERFPRFPNEPGMFIPDRRASMEQQMMEEQHLRSPGLRSPHIPGEPTEWDHGPRFGPRGNVQHVRESRDPRLRRREMMVRPREGLPFMDGMPPSDVRGIPPGLGHPPRAGIRRVEIEREEMIRRRLSVGDERDGPMSMEEREMRVWEMGEGHGAMNVRPNMHGQEHFPYERFDRGVEMREMFHMDGHLPSDRREAPHPMEFRGPPHMREETIRPIDRHQQTHPIGRPDLHGQRREPHHFEEREEPIDHSLDHQNPTESAKQKGAPTNQVDGPKAAEGQNIFHPERQGAPDEVPTSEEEESPHADHGEETNAEHQGQNPREVLPKGGCEHPVVDLHEKQNPTMGNPENVHNETKFNQNESQRQNEQLGEQVFRPGIRPQIQSSDERSVFDIRPEYHMEDRGPGFGPRGRRDDNRPIRVIGRPFRPRNEGPGRFPRNFHPNFGPRNFRPRHEIEGGRPRFRPMRGGPRLKRNGPPPFYSDQIKRPHY